MSQRDLNTPALRVVPAVCAHCGLEVPAAELRDGVSLRGGEELQFCCNGCRQVHAMLHDWGFDGYYQLLDRQGGRGTPAQVSGRRFEDFDDPGFIDQHSEPSTRETRRIRLYLEGVHCAACVWLVEELPGAVDGLVSVRLNMASAVAEVEWDPAQVALSSVARALDAIGYTPHPRRKEAIEEARRGEDRLALIRIGVAAVCAMNIMFIHGALYAGEHHGMEPRFASFFRGLSLVLAVPVLLFSARPFFRAAWAGLKQRVPHMDLPIAIALSAAFGYSAVVTFTGAGPVYFDSLAALVALLLGARFVQQRAQRHALERSENLRSVAFVEFARRLDASGIALEVPISALQPGDRVEVRSGELIPVDGLVLSGRSSLDNAVLTGEPEAIPVAPGDRVNAGATNLGARLVVDVQAAGEATRVGALLALVDQAMSQRAPIVQLADRISRVFVLVVLGLAVLAGLLGYLRAGDLGIALQQVVALLVVTCPCALGLATPVALTVALSRAARSGIFIKNPEAIEQLERVDTLLLDKTGTLTEGRARLQSWRGGDELRMLAEALEAESAHPVAQAFRRALERPLRPAWTVDQVREIPGQGIAGQVDGRAVLVGNRALLEAEGVSLDATHEAEIEALVEAGLSPVLVAVDGALAGLGGIGDRLRDDAAATVQALKKLGLRPQILSGDHPEVVARLAVELGIPVADAHGGMTPEDKRDRVAALRAQQLNDRRRGSLIMVGDGVNDAAALALADVGVAVQGSAGASVVAADVVLTRPGLAPVLELCTGSRRVLGVVRRNLGFSLLYNVVGASLALLGLVGPLLAALLMPISSLTVIGSSVIGRTFTRPARARAAVADRS